MLTEKIILLHKCTFKFYVQAGTCSRNVILFHTNVELLDRIQAIEI